MKTRLVKVTCPDCGYIVRTTRLWLAKGVPTCPCGALMAQAEAIAPPIPRFPLTKAALYFVRSGDAIKIGWTREGVAARMPVLQTGSPTPLELLKVIPGNSELEHEWHQRFAHLRIRGEWFSAADDLLLAIETAV